VTPPDQAAHWCADPASVETAAVFGLQPFLSGHLRWTVLHPVGELAERKLDEGQMVGTLQNSRHLRSALVALALYYRSLDSSLYL
jgi:hypothetical protein